jgi:ribosome maturation factor RimP
VPLLIKGMTFKEKVSRLLEEGLLEKPTLFLIDLTITESFKIIVTLDGDNGVALQDCIDISRSIDNNLDREEHDFSLEVASAGVSSPLKHIRQYKKNVGRILQVETDSVNIEAKLVEANDDFIVMEWEAREPKKIGKGKETVQKKQEISYTQIKRAIVIIIF